MSAEMDQQILTCAILAGGRSTRLGRDKAFERIEGGRLIDREVSVLSHLSRDIYIITTPEKKTLFPVPEFKQKIFLDIYPGKGVLAAIYTGLKYSATPYVLFVGCDMPFLSLDLLGFMVDQARSNCYDAIVPRLGNMTEPLHAIYSTACLPVIYDLVKSDRLKMSDLFNCIKTRYICETEIDRLDPQHLSFFNINTKDDLRRAEMVGRQLGKRT
jgi:molybdopterin-guanine dinucleotide biosynthesis protein A